METTTFKAVERGYYCSFCDDTTYAPNDAVGVLCRNCGLDTSNSGSSSPRRALQPPLNSDELSESAKAGRKHVRRRRLIQTGVAVATLTCVTLAGIGVTQFITATPGTTAATLEPVTRVTLAQANARHMSFDVEGYEATPVWVVAGKATQVVASDNADAVLVVTANDATAYDAATGDMLARYVMSPGDTSPVEAVATPTGFVVKRHDTVSVWGEDTEWRHGDIDADASLVSRGDMAVVVSAKGESSFVRDDATLTPMTLPDGDATLIAVTPTHVVWNVAGRVRVAPLGDATQAGRDVPVFPENDMTLDRIVGADAQHLYVLWRQGDKATLSSHDIETGRLIDSRDLSASDIDSPFLSIHGETFHAYANVTIDALTGAITPTPTGQVMTDAAGEVFIAETDSRLTIFHPEKKTAGKITVPENAAVVAAGSTGMILTTPEGVIALTPIQKETKK